LYNLCGLKSLQGAGKTTFGKKFKLSQGKAFEIEENIMEITIQLPKTGQMNSKVPLLTNEQKQFNEIFNFGC
jgi:hypothetical protein